MGEIGKRSSTPFPLIAGKHSDDPVVASAWRDQRSVRKFSRFRLYDSPIALGIVESVTCWRTAPDGPKHSVEREAMSKQPRGVVGEPPSAESCPITTLM